MNAILDNTDTLTLRQYRQIRNITAQQVSDHMGVSIQTVYMWESGKRNISTLNLLAIAKLYSIENLPISAIHHLVPNTVNPRMPESEVE